MPYVDPTIEVRRRLGKDFQAVYDYIDEGHDRHDLIIAVLDSLTMSGESTDELIKEVKDHDQHK